MGQGGKILISNKSSYTWKRRHIHSYQMNSWDGNFPERISPGESVSVYIEWNEGAFKNKKDDSAEAFYSSETGGKELNFSARAKDGFNLFLQCQNFSDPCAKSGENKKLGWSHDGVIVVTIVENQNHTGIIANNYSLANWMSFVDDHKLLSQLTIPGTHDSGALYGGDLVKCQNLSISGQLDAGIRFLDVRCRHIDNSFAIHHGMIYQKQNFKDILDSCYSFLNNHPGETIFMCVKHEYDDKNVSRSFEETFNDYIKNSLDKWYLKNDIPVLKDIRGKIVLLRRFGSCSSLGLKGDGNWNDNKTFSWTIEGTDKTVWVQDAYKVSTLFNIGDKWDKVKNMLDKTSQNAGKTLYINFTSGVSAGAYPYSVAYQNNGINKRLQQYLLEAERKQLGVFPMDFPEKPTGSLIPLLVRTNF